VICNSSVSCLHTQETTNVNMFTALVLADWPSAKMIKRAGSRDAARPILLEQMHGNVV